MNTNEAVRFFDGKKKNVAVALKISAAAVAQWGQKIPIRRQYELEKITKGKLQVRWDDRE